MIIRFYLSFFIAFLFVNTLTFSQGNFWTQTNGPNGGRISAMAFNSSGHIFIGSLGGGVYRSTDNGESWKQTAKGLSFGYVNAILVIPNGKIFAGCNWNGGISISEDNGENWRNANNGLPTSNTSIFCIINMPKNSFIFVGTNNGIFRSTNSGDLWMPVNVGLNGTYVYSLLVKNDNIFAGTDKGIYKSTDNGESWSRLSTGLPSVDFPWHNTEEKDINLSMNSKGVIYACYRGYYERGGIYRSTDDGNSWKLDENFPTGDTWRNIVYVNSSDHIFIKTWDSGIFRSTDDGKSWEMIYSKFRPYGYDWWETGEGAFTIGISPNNDVFIGAYGKGVYKFISKDNWKLLETGISNTFVQSLAVDSKGNLFAGAMFKGFFRSSDNGNKWENITGSIKFRVNNWAILPVPNTEILLAASDSGLYRSTNNGQLWDLGFQENISSLVYKAPTTIFAGAYNGGIYRSNDLGASWTLVTTASDKIFRVFTLAVAPNGNIFAGTFGGGVFRSTNGGVNWENVGNKNTGMIMSDVRGIVINSKGSIFAGTWGGGVYRSNDNGKSWIMPLKDQGSNCNFGSATIQSLTIDKYDQIYAGTNQWCGTGVYISKDDAETWNGLYSKFPDWNTRDQDLTNRDIYALVSDTKGNIYAGTNGCGVSFCDKPALWVCRSPFPNGDQNTVLNFTAENDGPLPGTQLLYVYNTGVGKINWTVTTDQPWVQATPSSGVGDGVVTVNINNTKLGYGVKNANITVSSNNAINSPQTFAVQYTLTRKPELCITPSNMAFTATQYSPTPASKNFDISNCGGGTLNWSISKNVDWLDLSSKNGNNNSTITVLVNTTNLNAGTYNGVISINSSNGLNGSQIINVTYLVNALPKIAINPTNLTFSAYQGGAKPPAKTFIITNSGGGSLLWNITSTDNVDWLDINPTFGGENTTVTASVNTTNFASGSKSATLLVSSSVASNSPQTIGVTYTIGPKPIISLSKLFLPFQAFQNGILPDSQMFEISNTGAGTLDWDIQTDVNWLTVAPKSGNNFKTIAVKVNSTDLLPGRYPAKITISSQSAANSPQTIDISYLIDAKSKISVNENKFTFIAIQNDTLPVSQILEISNSGGGRLDWNINPEYDISRDTGWLSLNTRSGINNAAVILNVNKTNLPPGTYPVKLKINAPEASNSPMEVTVNYIVLRRSKINLNKDSLNFSAVQNVSIPATQNFIIQNTGEAPLKWSLKNDDKWLILSPRNGENDSSVSSSVTVNINMTDINPNTYSSIIYVESPKASNSLQSIKVSFTLTKQAVISLDKNYLIFKAKEMGGLPLSQKFNISNSGGNALNWSLSKDQSWLNIEPISGQNTGEVTVNINTTNLDAGIYKSNIDISAPNAFNTPQQLIVSYIIEPPVEAAVSPSPFIPSKGHTVVTFFGFMLPNANIKIYNSTGKLIRTIIEDGNKSRLDWDVKNDNGENLPSGVYLWVLKSRTNVVIKGKLGVIR